MLTHAWRASIAFARFSLEYGATWAAWRYCWNVTRDELGTADYR